MAISFVNGFLCTSSCDVSKAKQGVDPHPKIDELQNSAKADATKNAATGKDVTDDSAVILGVSLRATSAAAAVSPAAAAQSPVAASIQAQGQIVNLLI
jgi:hypothetical protein